MTGYLRPVDPVGGRMSTYYAHTRRTTPSNEAGVDYYCPIGTPIRAAADGRVFEIGGGVSPATGRFVTIDLDDGRRVRYLHLKSWGVTSGQRVTRGQIVGLSGASGYGTEYFGASSLAGIPANTGGPHVHATLWAGHYYRYGRYPLEPTLDFELYAAGATAGGGATPFPTSHIDEETTMYVNATSPGQWVRQGYTYLNDRGGIWRGTTNLEGFLIQTLANEGRIRIVSLSGPDLDLLFAVNGVYEQPTLSAGNVWGPNRTPLFGMGAPTGRVMYPGTRGWEIPIVDDILADINKLAGTGGTVDPVALAVKIREGLAPEIVAELAKRLANPNA